MSSATSWSKSKRARRREQRAEALEELRDRREAQRHVRERRRRRLGRERAQRRRELLGILRGERPLGPRRERRRAEPEEAVALRLEPLGEPAGGLLDPPVLGEPPRELLGRLARARGRRARPPRPGRARAPSARAAPRPARGTRRTRPGRARRARRGARRTRRTISATSTSASSQLLPEDERQQQVERALERVEVELELADGVSHGAEASGAADAALRDRHLRARRRRLAPALAPARGSPVRGRGGTATRRRTRRERRTGRSRPRRSAAGRTNSCDGSTRSSSSKKRPNV